MLSETEIFERYRQHEIVQGGELYFSLPKAFDFLVECQENDIAVIGIEGFLCNQGMIKPQLDMIADYSSASASGWQEYREMCNQYSQDFLENLTFRNGLIVSFVVLSEKEWELLVVK